MLSPPLSSYTLSNNQISIPLNDTSLFNNRPSCQTSLHQQVQNQNEKHQILLGNQSPSNSLAVLDLKQSAKSIGDTLIYIFSSIIDFEEIKDQWTSLKTFLQPFNQSKVTDFFSQQKQRIVSKSNSSHQSFNQIKSDNIFNSSSIPNNIPSSTTPLNSNSNEHSTDVTKPIKSMPTSTRHNQSVGNAYIPNSYEVISNFNDIMKSINSTSVQNSSSTNIFLNNCQSPSAPSLLPASSTHIPTYSISQQNITQNNNNQSVNSSYLLHQLQMIQGTQRDDTSPQRTITSVSRCNSFTTTNYPTVSNFDTNNNSSTLNNQSLNCIKRDITPNQPFCSQQGISMTSRNKKESAWSQFKAIPISTFKLDVPRTNKHMPQLSSITTQYGSITNIPQNENEPTISPFNTQGQLQNCQNKRGSSQQQTKLQTLTNYQQHQTFIQQQKESLVRQTSTSQERSVVSKLFCENKPQPLDQQVINDQSQNQQQLIQLQDNTSFHLTNTQQMSPKLQRQTQQLGIMPSQNSQQNIIYNITSQNNVTFTNNTIQPNNNCSSNNAISINCIKSPNTLTQQNPNLTNTCQNSPPVLQVNQSVNISQKTLNQITQQSSNLSKPLQGISIQSNTSQQNFTQQKQVLSTSNSRNLLTQPPQNLVSSNQCAIYSQEASKENDRYAYLFSKENDSNNKDFSDPKNLYDNSKNHQSAGKQPLQKISQNKVINLNSYQVPSQYGQKLNIENCISPTKLQQQHAKSFQISKNLFQSPTQQGVSIQNTRLNTEVVKVNRFRTETDSKNKTNTVEQFLSTQASDQTYEASTYSQTQRSQSKYSTHNTSSGFQTNILKQKVCKLLQVSEENNIKIKAFNLK